MTHAAREIYTDSHTVHATNYLVCRHQIVDYGEDTGSANVVKLCGNFLIASSIEALGEAVALSEKNVRGDISLCQLM